MPGLDPGIHVSRRLRKEKTWMAGSSSAMTTEFFSDPQKIPFIIFVDAIFTTLFERLFTNSFDGGCEPLGNACVYPPRSSD
jgi:hypothetical protein